MKNSNITLEHDIACIDISLKGIIYVSIFMENRTWGHAFISLMIPPHNFGNSLLDANEQAQICAIGLWVDMSARLLLLPNLQIMLTESLGGGKSTYK